MSKKASKTLIGMFVLGAVALVVVAIVVLGSGQLFKRTFTAVCFFEGSVGGLNVGSPVVFRGVKIGSVRNIVLTYDPKDFEIKIPVYIEIDTNLFKSTAPPALRVRPGQNLKLLIERGLRARLEMQSIVTGQLQVSLDFYPEKTATYQGYDSKYPEIPTIPTPFQVLAKKIEKIPLDEIFEKLLTTIEATQKTIESMDEAIGENSTLVYQLNKTLEEVSSLSQSVRSLSDYLQRHPESVFWGKPDRR
jgi:ABC-type transporter Mla subunit MlaD